MSSDDECQENEVVSRQRKEKKDLRGKILAMKKAAKSGNKQRQKETNAECEKLEKEMEERHRKELAESAQPITEVIAEKKPEVEQGSEDEEGESGEGFYKNVKISSKQAKRQAKKKAVEEKMKQAVLEDREASKKSDKYFEKEMINQILAEKHFQLVEIRPDGDCMYNSIAHQLNEDNKQMTAKELRHECAEYMRANKDDFLPFVAEEAGSGNDSSGDWEKYLEGVEKLAESGGVWGGELELNALSRSLKRVIEVFKTDGTRTYGEEFESNGSRPLRIVYLRRAYQLGEHYNSTIRIT